MAEFCLDDNYVKPNLEVKIVVLNIDTLFLNYLNKPEEINFEIWVKTFRHFNQNVNFIINTQRSYVEIIDWAKNFEGTIKYAICNNGAVLTSLHDFFPIINMPIDKSKVFDVTVWCRELGLNLQISSDDGHHKLIVNKTTSDNELKKYLEMQNYIYECRIVNSTLYNDFAITNELETRFRLTIKNDNFNPSDFVINNFNVSANAMIVNYLRKSQLLPWNLLVCGGNVDDMELLSNAGFSIVLSDAPLIVKTAASKIIKFNNACCELEKALNKYAQK